MADDEKSAVRATVATVVATAAVTVAIGVTAAALGGYLVPAGHGGGSPPEQATEPRALGVPPDTAPPRAPRVVLVPVAPDSRAEPDAVVPGRRSEVLLAAYEARDDHDDYDDYDDDDDAHHDDRHGGHRERDHERDHDDD